MALNALGMGFVFTARDLATGVFQKLQSNISALSAKSKAAGEAYKKAMTDIKTGGLMAGAGLVTLGIMNKASKVYGEFEYTLVSAGQVMQATETQMKQLKDAAIEAGIKTQFSPTEAAAGLQALGAAGMDAATSIKVLNPVLDLAASSLGQLNVEMSAENVVGSLNAFGMTADKAGEVVDKLTRITQMSNFQARDFSVAISQSAAQAKAADQSYSSMLATLGLLRNTNLDASSAATAYREAVRRLSGDEMAQKYLRKLNVDSLDQQTGKIKDLGRIIAEMIPSLEKLNAKERNLYLTKILGVRGSKTYNAIMASYQKLLAEGKVKAGDYAGAQQILIDGLDNSAGTADKTREALLNTAKGQRILLQGSWETFQVMAGETLTPILIPALKAVTETLNALIKGFKAIPGPIKHFLSYALGTGAGLMILVGAFKVLRGVMGIFTLGRLAGQYVAGAMSAKAANDKLTESTSKLTIAERARRAGKGALGAVGGFMAGALAPAMIGISIISGLVAYEEQKEEERKKRERARQAMLKQTISLYDKQREAIARVAAETGRALDAEMNLAKKGFGQALQVLDKIQGRIGPLQGKLQEAWKAYQKAVADKKSPAEIQKQHKAFSEIAAKFRVEEMHRLDVQALVARQRYEQARRDKDSAGMQVYASQMVAGRVAKQLAGEAALAKWKGEREQYFTALKEKNIKQYNAEFPLYQRTLRDRKNDLVTYQQQTAWQARRLGLDSQLNKVSGPEQRARLLKLTERYRSVESEVALKTAQESVQFGKMETERQTRRGRGAGDWSFGGFFKQIKTDIFEGDRTDRTVLSAIQPALWAMQRATKEGAATPEPDKTLAGQMAAYRESMRERYSADPMSLAAIEGAAGPTQINLFVDSEKIATVVENRNKLKARQGDQVAGRVTTTARSAGRSR